MVFDWRVYKDILNIEQGVIVAKKVGEGYIYNYEFEVYKRFLR